MTPSLYWSPTLLENYTETISYSGGKIGANYGAVPIAGSGKDNIHSG